MTTGPASSTSPLSPPTDQLLCNHKIKLRKVEVLGNSCDVCDKELAGWNLSCRCVNCEHKLFLCGVCEDSDEDDDIEDSDGLMKWMKMMEMAKILMINKIKKEQMIDD